MIDRIIRELVRKRQALAVEAMESPGDGSPFTYGRNVGAYLGLTLAEQIIESLLEEQDAKERRS